MVAMTAYFCRIFFLTFSLQFACLVLGQVATPSTSASVAEEVTSGRAPTSLLRPLFAKSLAPNNTMILRLPFSGVYAELESIKDGVADSVFRHYTMVNITAAEFKLPDGLGAINSKSCFLFTGLIEGEAKSNVSEWISGQTNALVHGKRAWTWKMPGYEGHPDQTEFFAMDAPSGFLVCNDRGAFTENKIHGDAVNSDETTYLLCRKTSAKELGGEIPVAGVSQFCLQADARGNKTKVTVESVEGGESILAGFGRGELNVKGEPQRLTKRMWAWDLPSSGPFAFQTWFAVMSDLGFGVIV
jgi:hypothetical protein